MVEAQIQVGGRPANFDGIKPATIYFEDPMALPGPPGAVVTDLTWSSWGPTTAVGRGIWYDDECLDTCMGGPDIAYSAVVLLSHPEGGIFTQMAETFQGPGAQGPGPTTKSFSYPGSWVAGAMSQVFDPNAL